MPSLKKPKAPTLIKIKPARTKRTVAKDPRVSRINDALIRMLLT